MSEFVSLYDVIFGNQSMPAKSDPADIESTIIVGKIPLGVVVSTIQNSTTRGYWMDKFGRPVAANKVQVKAAIDELFTLHEMDTSASPYCRAEFEIRMDDPDSRSPWHNFGWPSDNLPDFELRHIDWRKQHSTMLPISPSVETSKTTRSSNAIWHIADIALRIVIENHLAGKRSAEEYIEDLMSPAHTFETMRMMKHLQTKGLDLGPEAFRQKLKEIFGKQ